MQKAIRTVKSKNMLARALPLQLSDYRPFNLPESELLMQLIDLDPVYQGQPEKFQVLESRQLWHQTTHTFAKNSGHWMEFGVRSGDSIRWLLEVKPQQQIHGFDSWEGLPEKWDVKGKVFKPGDMKVEIPDLGPTVHLHPGWFDQTLEPWCDKHSGDIAYLHIDSDLYSSAIYVLNTLNSRIVPGTVIVFDELCNFRLTGKLSNWPQHEWRALHEWQHTHKRKFKPVARTCMHQAAIEITE